MEKTRKKKTDVSDVPVPEILYRCDGYSHGITYTKYKVLSETPCGYWVKEEHDWNNDDKKWVSKTGKKRLCYPTEKEAVFNLLCRRKHYLRILNARIQSSNDVIYECEKILRGVNKMGEYADDAIERGFEELEHFEKFGDAF